MTNTLTGVVVLLPGLVLLATVGIAIGRQSRRRP